MARARTSPTNFRFAINPKRITAKTKLPLIVELPMATIERLTLLATREGLTIAGAIERLIATPDAEKIQPTPPPTDPHTFRQRIREAEGDGLPTTYSLTTALASIGRPSKKPTKKPRKK